MEKHPLPRREGGEKNETEERNMAVIAKERPKKRIESASADLECVAVEAAPPEAVAFESAIILRPLRIDAGRITTNAEAVLEAVRAKAAEYRDLSRYDGDDSQAKKDRALLRKQMDAIKTTDASVMEAWNEPLGAYRGFVARIKAEMTGAIDAIDAFVKEGEAAEKEAKLAGIRAHFDSLGFDLAPFERLADPRWGNKTYKLADIRREIDARIAEVHANLKTLEGIAEHGTVAKAFYLETLDIGAALWQVETLKANAERAAREKAERAERETRETLARNAAEEAVEARRSESDARIESIVALAALDEDEAAPAETKPVILWFECRFRGTREQLAELRECMTNIGVAYDKLGEGVVG